MTKFIYRRLFGLIIVVLGFSYCLTSFYNFYDYIFGNNIIANSNTLVMALGLVFPLYTFIFGMYFYFYHDEKFGNINPFIFASGIIFGLVGVFRLFISTNIMEFLHFSYSLVMIVVSVIIIYGCFRYKY